MSKLVVVYHPGDELPALRAAWRQPPIAPAKKGALIDFTTGWTFRFEIDTTPQLVKTTGISGIPLPADPVNDDADNLLVAFTAGELDAVSRHDNIDGRIIARDASNRDRTLPFTFVKT